MPLLFLFILLIYHFIYANQNILSPFIYIFKVSHFVFYSNKNNTLVQH